MYITICKVDSGNLLFDAGNPKLVLHDNLKECDGEEIGWRYKREGTYVSPWLIHADVWQKPSQCCREIIFQLKIKLRNKTLECVLWRAL